MEIFILKKIIENVPQPLLNDIIAERCIPIVGAGFSLNAIPPPGKKMPLWDDLGKEIADLVPNYTYSTPIDAISAYCYEFSRPTLIEELMKLIYSDGARPGPAHNAFSKLPFNIVCTTNFDFLLEKAYELKHQSIYCRPIIEEGQLSIANSAPGVSLIKLHGDIHHPNRLIVTEEDYDTFINRYPLLSTYLANLLITKTPLFIGYSLEDPDFRQIWQVIGNRLGQMRRPAYVLTVGIHSSDAARYERRGVKVVNLPGQANNYGQILETFFNELRKYWSPHLIRASTITIEEPLRELSLPEDAINRLCFFAIPLNLHSFYKSFVFPIVESFGLVPLISENVISPGDNIIAKVIALLDRAQIVIADVSSPWVLQELGMAFTRKPTPPEIIIIKEEGSELPTDFKDINIIYRPIDLTSTPEEFLFKFEELFRKLTENLISKFDIEPQRLLDKKEYRAAVITSFILLETTLKELIPLDFDKWFRRSVYKMLDLALKNELINYTELKILKDDIAVRNSLVHSDNPIGVSKATKIVNEVIEIIDNMKQKSK